MQIDAKGLYKTYRDSRGQLVQALCGVDVHVSSGDFVAISGPSGCGKSTLLNVLGCLDRPDAGFCQLDGEDVAGWPEGRRAAFRNRRLGFVFQSFHLLPFLNVRENVDLPLLYVRDTPPPERLDIAGLLGSVGLAGTEERYPSRVVGRAAAACRDCSCARPGGRSALGRRADRQSRSSDRPTHPRSVRRACAPGSDDHSGHPRSRCCGPCESTVADGGRHNRPRYGRWSARSPRMTSTNIRAALQVVTAQPARTILLALPVAVSTALALATLIIDAGLTARAEAAARSFGTDVISIRPGTRIIAGKAAPSARSVRKMWRSCGAVYAGPWRSKGRVSKIACR